MAKLPARAERLARVRATAEAVFYMRAVELDAGDLAHIRLPRSLMDELKWKPGHQLVARAFKGYGQSSKKGVVLLEVD